MNILSIPLGSWKRQASKNYRTWCSYITRNSDNCKSVAEVCIFTTANFNLGIYTEERENTNLLTQIPKADQEICHIITISMSLISEGGFQFCAK